MTKITARFPIPGHGTFTVPADALDVTMARYLPVALADVRELRKVIAERQPEIDWSDLKTVSECLIVLAELDGYGL